MAKYHDWLASCHITAWQRIDEGVDLDGTGFFDAIGDGVVTGVWYGVFDGQTYFEYKLTEPGNLYGMHVYHAEGVGPLLHKGDKVYGGQHVCSVTPGGPTGTESGWSSGNNDARTWAADFGGGYNEGDCTQSGISFNRLTKLLHGYSGSFCQGSIVGDAPDITYKGLQTGGGSGTPVTVEKPSPIDVGAYDWSPQVKDAMARIASKGGYAALSSGDTRDFVGKVTYCDIGGWR